MKNPHLIDLLQVAVPIWQRKLKDVPMADLIPKVQGFGVMLAEQGDKLLYGSQIPGESAKLFNQTAEAIAVMSFLPGGITLFGQHFEMMRPPEEGTPDANP